MKKKKGFLYVLLFIFCVVGFCGCEDSSKKDANYGYYTREDGRRIWYEK